MRAVRVPVDGDVGGCAGLEWVQSIAMGMGLAESLHCTDGPVIIWSGHLAVVLAKWRGGMAREC